MLLLTEDGSIIAARDRWGRTPVVIGRKDGAYAATSESSSFPNLDYEIERYLGPGEIVRMYDDHVDQHAEEKGIKVQHGVYIGTQGPTFETPAEYKLFHILGADAVGMSTVPEVIVANHCGIKVFGISVITDLGVEGKIVEVTHEEVQKAADAAQPKMTTIMRELINRA